MTADDSTAKRAGLDPDLWERWGELVAEGVNEKNYGAFGDVLTELHDWFTERKVIYPYALSEDEALDLYRDLAKSYDLCSDAEDELYRVKILGLGADRSAVEVLEDLVEMERQALREREATA